MGILSRKEFDTENQGLIKSLEGLKDQIPSIQK